MGEREDVMSEGDGVDDGFDKFSVSMDGWNEDGKLG